MRKRSKSKAGGGASPRPFPFFPRKPGFSLSPFRPLHLWKGKHFALLGGMLVALILFYLSLNKGVQIFEWRTLDMRFQHRVSKPIKTDMAIVFIGDDGIQAFGRWPWPWEYHALLVDVLKRHGAKAIIFDILFSEKPRDQKTDILSLAVKSAGTVYLCSYFNELELNPIQGLPAVGAHLTEPVPGLNENAKGLGHCNAIPDDDGITRRIPIIVRHGDDYFPSTALRVAADEIGASLDNISVKPGKFISLPLEEGGLLNIPIDSEGQTLINFAGDINTFESYSFLQVLQADQFPEKAVLDLECFRDKLVLVGVTFAGNTDLRPTPLSSAYPMLCILGNSIDNIVQRDFVFRDSLLSRLFLAVFLGAITGFLSYVLRPIYSLSSMVVITGAFIWYSVYRFDQHQLWVDLIAPLTIIVGNYLTMTTIQYIQNRREKMHYIEYLKYMDDLVESSSDAIVSFDMQGIIVTWNTGAKKIYGWTTRQALGKNWKLLVSHDSTKEVEEALQATYEKGNPQGLEIQGLRGGKEAFPASMNLSPVQDSRGIMVGVSCISQDLTEKKKMVELLVQSEKMAELGRLGSGIVHEIKNPLTSIMMLSSMMLAIESADEKVLKYAGIIDQEAQRILRLSQNILSFARPKKPEMKVIDLRNVIRDTISLVEYELKKSHVELTLNLTDSEVPALGDDEKLKQVFLNLIINAAHAMEGGGRLEITAAICPAGALTIPKGFSIQSSGSLSGDTAAVATFRDHGCGIQRENLEKIFEPFFTTKAEGKGTGLGLYISQQIVLNHRGSLTVASLPGQGTIFHVSLPVTSTEIHDAEKTLPKS